MPRAGPNSKLMRRITSAGFYIRKKMFFSPRYGTHAIRMQMRFLLVFFEAAGAATREFSMFFI